MNEQHDGFLRSYRHCTLCPRQCGADRSHSRGFCGCGDRLTAARAALHRWEEPVLSGPEWEPGGSGTVFFSGCTLRCHFCQNRDISRAEHGRRLTAAELCEIFLRLQAQGAHNINLVTPTQWLPTIVPAIELARPQLTIPIVYNCGGYERAETVRALKGLVDIWLPDFKYFDPALSSAFSQAADYFEQASAAVRQMIAQSGPPRFLRAEGSGKKSFRLMTGGVIIRHLVLPGHRDDSIALLRWMHANLPQDGYLISLMSQYTPYVRSERYPELNRRITSYEYDKVVDEALRLGMENGFMQKKSSAREEYTPPFNLEGL